MEFLKDWRFWSFICTLLSLLCTIGLALVGRWIYFKIKLNDFQHLTNNFKEFKKEIITKIDKLDTKVDENGQRISKIEGILSK